MFGKDVFGWILQGCDVSGSDYAAAPRCRERRNRVVQRALGEVDVLLTPTTPLPAQRISDSSELLSTTHHLKGFAFPLSWAGLPKLRVYRGRITDWHAAERSSLGGGASAACRFGVPGRNRLAHDAADDSWWVIVVRFSAHEYK